MEIIELHSLLKEAGFIQDIVDKFDGKFMFVESLK